MKEADVEHTRIWLTFLKLIPFFVGKKLSRGGGLAWPSLNQLPHSDRELPGPRWQNVSYVMLWCKKNSLIQPKIGLC